MASACADQQQHKFQPAHQLFLDIPPRKLLSRRISPESPMDIYQLPHEALIQKFLPYNSGDDSDADPYSADQFRMYEFKVRKCTRSRSHDWTDCPFAHPGEKARRRCPQQFNYSGIICSDFRRGSCSRGDSCEFAHGVFEYWLHPSRYRTEACKDGNRCPRKVCFFAHTPSQLRVSPPETMISPGTYPNSGHFCSHCRCHSGMHHHTASPTSTLNMGNLSPPTSPLFSPAQTGPGFSRFASSSGSVRKTSMDELPSTEGIYELMNSMEAMNVNEFTVPNTDSLWVDTNCFNGGTGDDDHNHYFAFSAPTRTPSGSDLCEAFSRSCSLGKNPYAEMSMNESSVAGPDLDWVNDLLA